MSKLGQENQTREFKRELSDSLEKEVVAFLNSALGGDIYIGVANPDVLMLSISDRIRNNIQPTCLGLYDIIAEIHDDKTVL